ncbi:MAG: hypothetical protein WDO56_13830 [Gammaproteobacteria bacterium]
MLPANLRERVSRSLQELLVRREHDSIEVELNDRRRTPDGRNVPLQITHARHQRPKRPTDPRQRIIRHVSKPPTTHARANDPARRT